MNDLLKTCILVYLTAFLAGIAFPVSGILSPQIAAHFDVPTTRIVFIDSLVLLGLICGNIASGKIINILKGRKTILLAVVLLFFDQLGIALQNLIIIYAIFTFLFGFSMGILIPAVNFIIVDKFESLGQSSSKLNIMSFFVGIGAFLGSCLSGVIASNYSWRVVFIITSTIFFIIFIFASLIKISENSKYLMPSETGYSINKNKAVTLGVVLTGLALIAYVYTEYIITYWFSPYLQESLKYNVQTVGLALSCFWLSLAIGRYIFGAFIIYKVQDYLFIVIAASVTIAGFIAFIFTHNFVLIFMIIVLLGFSCSGIYPTMIGYGMKQPKFISPLTMSFLVTSGSLGGGLSLLTSAVLGSYLPKIAAIYMGPVCCMGIIVLILLSKVICCDSK